MVPHKTFSADDYVPTEHIDDALNRLASYIAARGDKALIYLPIYQRLEREFAARREEEEIIDRIRLRVALLNPARKPLRRTSKAAL